MKQKLLIASKLVVEWVKDSIIRVRLAILADEVGQKPGSGKGGKNAQVALVISLLQIKIQLK